ncbi:MAG TPA: hypothetical protein DCE41_08075 [Cytophagales bacterium]|nr:hypothetical protein [Cytophagales bacterium]
MEEWIGLISSSSEFITYFTEVLKESPFEGFFWEVVPVTTTSLYRDFEFVLVQSNKLPKIEANPDSFQEHFNQAASVVTFPNLGGDAQLVVPSALGSREYYGHLGAFLRNAPREQIDLLWRTVGQEYQKRIQEKPVWLSTAGLGVPWLHIRVDSRPKYYRYSPFKSFAL